MCCLNLRYAFILFHIVIKLRVTGCPPIGKYLLNRLTIWFEYEYLIVNLVFSTSVFEVGICFWLHPFWIVAYLYLLITDLLRYTDKITIRFQQSGLSLTFMFCYIYQNLYLGIA